jgi:hypothetical protein
VRVQPLLATRGEAALAIAAGRTVVGVRHRRS